MNIRFCMNFSCNKITPRCGCVIQSRPPHGHFLFLTSVISFVDSLGEASMKKLLFYGKKDGVDSILTKESHTEDGGSKFLPGH
jgi:hypothetical protein